jgi:hypothetical protein
MYKIISTLLVLLFFQFIQDLPQIFVIGDSISIHYGTHLEKYLQGKFRYDRKNDSISIKAGDYLDFPQGANGGDSKMVLAYLKFKLNQKNFKPDILLLNCGLHDIKRNPQTNVIQVDTLTYKQNLENIYTLLKKQKIRLIWIRTTPVVDSIHNLRSKNFYRYAKDLDIYNRIADEVWDKRKVQSIDLYTFTKKLGNGVFTDHVHYDESTCVLQAAFLAGYLSHQSMSK